MKSSFALLLSLFLCSACQMAPPPTPSEPVQTQVPATTLSWIDKLQEQATTLPAAQVSREAGRITIAYPQESLFTIGSVLPFAGGAEVLAPLATLLVAFPEAVWEARVQAATTNGNAYDLSLAQKRSELLQRYLLNSGVPPGRVNWEATSGDGIPLLLTLRPLHPPEESSSGVKE